MTYPKRVLIADDMHLLVEALFFAANNGMTP